MGSVAPRARTGVARYDRSGARLPIGLVHIGREQFWTIERTPTPRVAEFAMLVFVLGSGLNFDRGISSDSSVGGS